MTKAIKITNTLSLPHRYEILIWRRITTFEGLWLKELVCYRPRLKKKKVTLNYNLIKLSM